MERKPKWINPDDPSLAFGNSSVQGGGLAEIFGEDASGFGYNMGAHRDTPALAKQHEGLSRTLSGRGERRILTVMFVDLVGSTSMAERLDPEDLLEVIRIYRVFAAGVVGRFGSAIAQVAGDGILAYFGYPIARENDPERAARAALALVKGIGNVATPDGVPLSARVGIATGRVVVSDIVSGGFSDVGSVTGAVVNLASRLQSFALPNSVVISEQSYDRLGSQFFCEPLGAVALQGIAQAHLPWKLNGERPRRRDGSSNVLHSARLTPFHGREGEFAVLCGAWKSAENGRGQAVLIQGEAGVGKSRLVEHLLNDSALARAKVISMAALALDEDSPLRPFVSYFRAEAGLLSQDSPALCGEKIAAILEGSDEQKDTALPIVTELAAVPALDTSTAKLPPNELREATLNILTGQFLARSRKQSLCIVVEDLHWIDPSSAELLDRLIERISDLPVLLLMTSRMSLAQSLRKSCCVRVLPLPPLGREHVIGMLNYLFRYSNVKPKAVTEIANKTDGVPLFVEEVGRALLSQTGRDLEKVEVSNLIPASLEDLLMARLDSCGPAKEIAQVAAVAGRSVFPDLLASVCDANRADLARPLATLLTVGVFERHLAAGGEYYMFSHALVRDVAYASLLRSRRKELHAKVARAIQTLDPSAVALNPEILALHLTQGGEIEAAAPHWLEAGRRNLARSALTEAVRVLQRALSGLESLPPTGSVISLRIQVGGLLGTALGGLKGPNCAELHVLYARALELCRQSPEEHSHFPIYWGWWRLKPASLDRAATLLDRARAGEDRGHLLQAHHSNWAAQLNAGLLIGCCEHAMAGLELYETGNFRHHAWEYGNHDAKICAHGIRAQARWLQGRLRSGLEDEIEALAWGRQLDHLGSRVHALGLSLVHRTYRRDYRVILDRAAELSSLVNENELTELGSECLIFRGWVRALQGATTEGLAMLRRGLQRQTYTATNEDYSIYLCLLAEALMADGRPEEAAQRLMEERAAIQASGVAVWQPEYLRVMGEAILAADPTTVQQARNLFCEGAALAKQQGAAMLYLRIAASELRLDQATGAKTGSLARLQEALADISEPDGSADLVDAAKLIAVFQVASPRD